MSVRFATWREAHAEAQRRANAAGIDVAVRRVSEYGVVGFNVKYASRMDSDYALAEIVTPERRQR